MEQLKLLFLLLSLFINIIIIVLLSFSPLEFLFVPLAFVQALYFYSLPGSNMYVPGDCNILLISVCDL